MTEPSVDGINEMPKEPFHKLPGQLWEKAKFTSIQRVISGRFFSRSRFVMQGACFKLEVVPVVRAKIAG